MNQYRVSPAACQGKRPIKVIIQPRAIIRLLKSRFKESRRRTYGPLLLYSLIRAQYAGRWENNCFWLGPHGRTLRDFADRLGCDLRTIKKSWGRLLECKAAEPDPGEPAALTSKYDNSWVQYLLKGAQVFRLLEVEPTGDGISDKYEAAILARRDLSDLAKVLFIVVSSLHHSGAPAEQRAKPGEWYATVLGTHRSKVVRALAQLRAINAVIVIARRRESDHYKAANLIEPLTSNAWLPDRKRRKGGTSSADISNHDLTDAKWGHENEQKEDMNSAKWGHDNEQNGVNIEISAPEVLDPEEFDQEVCSGEKTAAIAELLKSPLKTEKKEDTPRPMAAEKPPTAVSENRTRTRAVALPGRTFSDTRSYISAVGLAAMIAEYAASMRLSETELLRVVGRTERAYAEVPESESAQLITRVAAMYGTWTQGKGPQQSRTPAPGMRV